MLAGSEGWPEGEDEPRPSSLSAGRGRVETTRRRPGTLRFLPALPEGLCPPLPSAEHLEADRQASRKRGKGPEVTDETQEGVIWRE